MPGDGGDVPEVGEVDQPPDLVDLAMLELQRLDQLLAQDRVHPGRDLEPHDLAEAPGADLLLDRLEEVVRLVGDGEVGVAGDAEVAVVDHLGAGEERVEVGGDHVLEGDEPGAVLAHRDEAAEQLLRHLDPGDDLVAALRVAKQDAEAEREVGYVGEGTAEADHQRRQGREHLLVEVLVDLRPLGLARRGERDDADALLLQGRAQGPAEAAVEPGVELQNPLLDRVDLLPGREPVGAAGVDAGVDLVEQPGDPDHEELVEVGGVDGAELDPLQQRHRGRPRPAPAPAR